MKLEVGMYVRIKNRGIAKFRGWNAYDENKVAIHTHNEGDIEITPVIDKNTIIKASYNIIDLIEVGDYVNGFPVIHKENDILKCGLLVQFKENEIKSIVTKEQFESMKYSLEG